MSLRKFFSNQTPYTLIVGPTGLVTKLESILSGGTFQDFKLVCLAEPARCCSGQIYRHGLIKLDIVSSTYRCDVTSLELCCTGALFLRRFEEPKWPLKIIVLRSLKNCFYNRAESCVLGYQKLAVY